MPKIRAFNPNSFSFVICHSYVSKLKIQLEKTGLFSNLRLERNLVKATNGRLISLDDQQKAILLSVAESDNIKNKSVVIQGPEGSGKTLLGLEVAKMMINYHINETKLRPKNDKEKIRVIFAACFKRREEVGLLLKQWTEQLDPWKPFCDISYEPIEAQDVQNPKEYYSTLINELIKNVEAKKKTKKQYKKNILVIDELNPGFETTDWSVYEPQKKFQVIFCLKYAFDDQKIKSKRKIQTASSAGAGSGSNAEEQFIEEITSYDHVIVGKLQKGHRCSNQIRRLVYYLLIHSPDHEHGSKFKNFYQGLKYESFDAKYCPSWIEKKSLNSFITAAKEENLHCSDPDVMLIHDPHVDQEDLSKLKDLCENHANPKWKCASRDEIVGAEASTVIIYNLEEFHFEAFTRAINNLIIITTSSSK